MPSNMVSELCLTFEDLKEGGEQIDVTVHNRKEYVKLKIHWELVGKRKAQLEAVKRGFWSVPKMETHLRQLRTSVELEMLLCGERSITAEMLFPKLRFVGFPSTSKTPEYLKSYLRKLDEVRVQSSSIVIKKRLKIFTPPIITTVLFERLPDVCYLTDDNSHNV